MSNTSRLGSSDTILGFSFVLGVDGGGADPLNVLADSTLSLTDVSTGNKGITASASSTLSLSDTANGPIFASADSTLALTTSVEYVGPKFGSTVNVLTLTDAAHLAAINTLSASNAVTITDSATRSGTIRVSASSPISLTDVADDHIYAATAESTLSLTQVVSQRSQSGSGSNTVSLTQSAVAGGSIRKTAESVLQTSETQYNIETGELEIVYAGLVDSASVSVLHGTQTASNIISFAQPASGYKVLAGAIDCTASSTLTLTDEGEIAIVGDATSTLSLTQDATPILSNQQPESELSLGSVAGFNVVRGAASLETELEVTDSVAFILDSDNLCSYSPFIGSSSDPNAPTPPPADLPALAGLPDGVRFRLSYPATGTATDTLDLRAPDFGNQDRLAFSRINRETRGGTLIVYADPLWPKQQTLNLNFSGLKREVSQALLTFIDDHLGEQIKLLDWEGRAWVGVIMTPNEPVIEDSRNRFHASFEFEGEPV